MPNSFVFQKNSTIKLGGNYFINVPIVLQHDDTPLIEVINEAYIGTTTQIPIFHEDGTKLGKVVGTRFFATKEGETAGVKIVYQRDLLVASMGNNTLFEIRRNGAASIAINAEIYSTNGCFVNIATDKLREMLNKDGESITLNGMSMTGCTINECRIGVHLRSNGSVGIGCN